MICVLIFLQTEVQKHHRCCQELDLTVILLDIEYFVGKGSLMSVSDAWDLM